MADTIDMRPVTGQSSLPVHGQDEKAVIADLTNEKPDKEPTDAKEDHGGYMVRVILRTLR